MQTQTKLQIDSEDYEFIKGTHKQLNYKSLSEYIRQAVKEKKRQIQKGSGNQKGKGNGS
jgi:Arc/MetJ-type ribon-helix-helix transcriptional regulator